MRRRKLRRLGLIALGILLLIVVGYFSARTAINAVRGWQARRHAQKAFALIDQEKWGDARDEALAAYRLRATEPEAIRAVARLLSRAGQADAFKFWKELEERTTLKRGDLRDKAGVALRVRELEVAEQTVNQLIDKREGGPTPTDWLLAAQLAVQEQDIDIATAQVRKVFASSAATPRDQFQATLLLETISRSKEGRYQTEVLDHLASLSQGSNSVALDALAGLGQTVITSNAEWPNPGKMSIADIIKGLETHPSATTKHKLLAIDLKIREHPDQRATLLQDAIIHFKGGDNATLLALATWLNANKEFQRELEAVPRERAMQTRELFFQYVDALGALGRWDDIRRLIESEQFPLDPVMEHMYLARCYLQQNQQSGAENNWRRALQAAAGDVTKLMILADYAEKNGAQDVAASAYDAAVAVSPRYRVAQQGRLRMAYASRDTKKIHSILSDLLKLWPKDPAVQNDEAYARLLLLPDNAAPEDVEPIESLAENLVQREPASLPHRTVLALARLKQNRPNEALDVYKNINVPPAMLTTSSVAVHSAVLAAVGHKDEARAEVSHLPMDRMLPEEKVLIDSIKSESGKPPEASGDGR